MKSTLCFVLLALTTMLPLAGRAQTYVPKGDCAFVSTKQNFHFVHDDQPLLDAELEGIPQPQPKPVAAVVPAAPHPLEVAESERAYADGRLDEAAAAVAALAQLDPADPTVLHCYARALYRNETTRDQSYPVYRRLIALLDRYGREGPRAVAVYLPFPEAYFKLATLQLDQGQWSAASYNLSRTAAALQSIPETASENALLREQILQYQTECFAHLRQPALCRYFGQRTLRFYPENQYVKSYLAALPPVGRKPAARPRR